MKLSNILNIISALLTLLFLLFLITRSFKAGCFSWIDYGFGFSTLFLNLGISILSAMDK